MRVRIVGAHNLESRDTRYTSLLINDTLAIDAGSLTSELTFEEQSRLEGVLLSHGHYDHVRDIPALGLGLFSLGHSVAVFGESAVLDGLKSQWLNGTTYPRLHEVPPERPALRFTTLQPGESFELSGNVITPMRTNHATPSLGFRVEDGQGHVLFYTSDTGPLSPTVWQGIAADLLVIEVTMPSAQRHSAQSAGHLTPELLKQELRHIALSASRMPRVIAVHVNPALFAPGELESQLADMARELGIDIAPGSAGMEINLQ